MIKVAPFLFEVSVANETPAIYSYLVNSAGDNYVDSAGNDYIVYESGSPQNMGQQAMKTRKMLRV